MASHQELSDSTPLLSTFSPLNPDTLTPSAEPEDCKLTRRPILQLPNPTTHLTRTSTAASLDNASFIYGNSARSDQMITDDGQQKTVAMNHFEASPLTPPRTPTIAKAVPPFSPTPIPTPGDEDPAEEPVQIFPDIPESTEDSPIDPTPLTSKATQTTPFTDADLAPAIQSARTEHLCRLADLFTNLTALASTHDTTLSTLYANKITSLESRLAALTTQHATLTTQHATDLAALHAQLAQARDDHTRETHALLARKDEELARAVDAVRVEMARHAEERVRLVIDEMRAQMDERVRAAREEMAVLGDERVAAVKEEVLARQQRRMTGQQGGRSREGRGEVWAVARLWGVGGGRSR